MISNAGNASATTHVLLTVLGKEPKRARYSLRGREVEALLAPVALLDLMPEEERPGRILAVCTPEAKRESWPLLERALNGRCFAEPVDVAGGETREDFDAYLAKLAGAVPGDAELTVDVTHGFRHFSYLTYIAVLYMNALREVRVRGAWYGLLNRGRPSPFLDLRPLLNLPDWIHALRVLRETGSAMPMARLLCGGSQNRLAQDLSRLSEAYLSGLPIELGRQAHTVRRESRSLKRALAQDHRLPLAQELIEQIDRTLAGFALNDPPSGEGWKEGWKRRIALSESELERQAQIVDVLLDRGNRAAALGLMNEWTVSWVALRRGWEGEWLDYRHVRRKAAGLLGAIKAVGQDGRLRNRLTEDQCSLGMFWEKLGTLRNAYHHHGMRPQPLTGERQAQKTFDDICVYWRETLRRHPQFSLSLGESHGGRILISPIGNRPGVLYSALHACREGGGEPPSLCLAICSRESEGGITEAACKAEYKGVVERLRFADPHGGLGEIEALTKTARGRLIGAEDVFVNVTGGTTLMGLAADAMANAARDLACPAVRRFGLVDRRPPAEQDAEPYRIGKPFWLDRGEAGDAN